MTSYIRKLNLLLIIFLSLLTPFYMKGAESARQLVVVLDAGHGGHDNGACDNGVKEKDVNLATALKVGKMIEKNLKNVKVVYTRDNDSFVSLQGRADIANKAKGDIFISIHTNSVAETNPNRKTVKGASVYTLGAHKDAANLSVAQRENSVISLEKNSKETYQGFDPNSDESYIIFEMAQKKNLSESVKFAADVQSRLVKEANRGDKGLHQAGFWVLWATSMPSVLIELDFICNPESAAYISTDKGQEEMASAIYNSIKTYTEDRMKGPRTLASGNRPASTPPQKEAVSQKSRTETAKEPVHIANNTKKENSSKRKRRNKASSEASNKREVAVADVGKSKELTSASTIIIEEESSEKQTAPQDDKKNNVTTNDKNKKNKKNKKKAPREKMVTVYTIQLLVSDRELNASDSLLAGFSPVTMKKENNLYKYYFGESKHKTEMENLLKEVKEKVPDAKIVKTTKVESHT